jgi:hypothetical protein
MHSLQFHSFFKRIDPTDFAKAAILTLALFAAVVVGVQVYASTVTLSVTVQTSLTFNSSTNNFSIIQPTTAVYATTTLSVLTNDTAGYNITLSGDQKNNQPQNNLQLNGATSTQITDQTEWVPGNATTSAGDAVRISSFVNGGNVLAFRVMTASSSNGTPFLASAWWGTTDSYTDSGTTLWAGISSSTIQRQIGNAGTGSYSATAHLNTVLYYLNVSASQPTGTYNAPITYTATGN